MTQKTFIPFYEVKNHVGDVLVVDAHHPQGFDLSHWRGAPVPEGCEADTSTEIVLNAIDHKLPELEKTFVTNNHYDIDGFLGVWSVFNQHLAQEYRSLLVEIAQIADFREINFEYREWEKALKLVCWLNELEAEKFYPPFGAPEIAEKEMEACVPKYLYFLDVFESYLTGKKEIPTTKEYELVINQLNSTPFRTEYNDIRLQVVEAENPLHYYCLYAESQNSDVVISIYNDNRYELEYKYTTWVQTTREHFPRVDLKPLVEQLNSEEASDYKWDAEHFTDTAPILRLKGKKLSKKERYSSPVDRPIYESSIPPLRFQEICINFFRSCYEQISSTKETKSWHELREMNKELFS
jgi:hypothetical protein